MQQLGTISIDGNIVNARKIMKKKIAFETLWMGINVFFGAEMKMEKETPS